MRVVNKPEELARAFQAAQAEAKSTFGHDGVYLERYFLEPRHIEVQIVADNRGHVVHLGERDCSIQRRHQKLVEETPSPAIDERLRREIGRTAVEAVKAIRYCNVGTVEFLLDKDRNFFFMEVNTRIQVEHRVSELCYALRFHNPADPEDYFDVQSVVEVMAILAKHKARLPKPDRIDFVGSMAAAWVRLRRTEASERRVALVLDRSARATDGEASAAPHAGFFRV